MVRFSDDGQWWWNGTTWVPTAQVVVPDLPTTEFEQSGRLEKARSQRKNSERLFWANTFAPLRWLTGSALIVIALRASRGYRSWTLEQLALVTDYLLGPDEPVLAGEGGGLVPGETNFPPWTRDLTVAVTASHVLVFRIDSVDGQPRWIEVVARPSDVRIEVATGMRAWREGIPLRQPLIVFARSCQWTIHAAAPDPVIHAWRRAASSSVDVG